MAWTAQVTLDIDKTDVGMTTAIWNVGLPDEFQHSRRAKISVDEGQLFAKEAVAARRADIEKKAREAPLAITLAGMLATEEAKT